MPSPALCCHSLHFNISHGNPDREKVTRPDSNTSPLSQGLEAPLMLLPSEQQQFSLPSCEYGAGGSHGQCRVFIRLAAIPRNFQYARAHAGPESVRCVPCLAAGFPSKLKHSKLGPRELPSSVGASGAPVPLLADPEASSPATASSARPPSLLPSSTASHLSAQAPCPPSGTTFLFSGSLSPHLIPYFLGKCLFFPLSCTLA